MLSRLLVSATHIGLVFIGEVFIPHYLELFISFFLYAVYFYPVSCKPLPPLEAALISNAGRVTFKVFLCYSASYRSRLANLLGVYVVLVLFSLRVVIDLPSYVVTYARDVQYLVFNVVAAIPAILAYAAVLGFFVVRSFTFRSCDTCRIISLEVTDTEEQYVRRLFMPHDFKIAVRMIHGYKKFQKD